MICTYMYMYVYFTDDCTIPVNVLQDMMAAIESLFLEELCYQLCTLSLQPLHWRSLLTSMGDHSVSKTDSIVVKSLSLSNFCLCILSNFVNLGSGIFLT